jgi:UDP-N-acetylmuramate--alanine ligase
MRRFAVYRTSKGVTVIDDYAHNPDKIRAALLTARDFGKRIFAVFQPHGYGPTRFLKDELVETFARFIRDTTKSIFCPFITPGAQSKDISSGICGLAGKRGIRSHAPQDRKGLLADHPTRKTG